MKAPSILVCILMSPSVLLCGEYTGTVYSDHSGPSGHGTGYLRLATGSKLARIHYQKPIDAYFASPTCREVGAIWRVWTTRISPRTEELARVHCDGRVDVPVHSAWQATRDYIKAVALGAGQLIGYQPGRRGPIFVTMDQIQVDVSGYLDFGASGMCLDMKERVNRKTVVIGSTADCYFEPDIDFIVEEHGSGDWRVTSVVAKPAPKPRSGRH